MIDPPQSTAGQGDSPDPGRDLADLLSDLEALSRSWQERGKTAVDQGVGATLLGIRLELENILAKHRAGPGPRRTIVETLNDLSRSRRNKKWGSSEQ